MIVCQDNTTMIIENSYGRFFIEVDETNNYDVLNHTAHAIMTSSGLHSTTMVDIANRIKQGFTILAKYFENSSNLQFSDDLSALFSHFYSPPLMIIPTCFKRLLVNGQICYIPSSSSSNFLQIDFKTTVLDDMLLCLLYDVFGDASRNVQFPKFFKSMFSELFHEYTPHPDRIFSSKELDRAIKNASSNHEK